MSALNEEQVLLRDSAKAWVREKSPVTALRRLRDSGSADGFDRAAWREMCAMGWAGVLIPEQFGGSGLGYRTIGLLLEETGRTLTASPLLSTALVAASALILGGSAAQKDTWLPKIAEAEAIALKAEKPGSGYALSGEKRFVPDGGAADLIVVAARTSGRSGDRNGITLFLVEGGAKDLSRQGLHRLDTRGVANLAFDNVAVDADDVLGTIDRGFDLLDAVLDRARAGLAAEMLRSEEHTSEITLDYLKTRTQFGQAIGTFQALQHRAAKMFTELELTRSCVEAALDGIDRNANDVPALASLAKARAGDLWHLVSNEMVQMHGGIGMTDAHDAGLYLKRARVAEALYGNSAFHRDRYASLMGY